MKSMKKGGGGRFQKLKGELAHKKGIKNPGAVAAAIGRKKYGKKGMAKMSAKGRHRAAEKRHGGMRKDKATGIHYGEV